MDEKARKTIAIAEQLIGARLLVAELDAKLRAHVCDQPEPQGLRSPPTVETRVLAFVVEKAPKIVTPSAAADQLAIARGTAATILGRLFEKGFITRVSHGCYTLPEAK